MSSFGRDDLSHLSMSLHMELNRTYGTSRIACFIWRHTSSIAFRSGRQKLQLHAVQAPDLLPDEFRPVLRRAVGYHQDLPEPFACGLQELDKLLPGKGAVSLEEPLPVQRDQAEHDGLGVRSRVRVDAADPFGRVDALPET